MGSPPHPDPAKAQPPEDERPLEPLSGPPPCPARGPASQVAERLARLQGVTASLSEALTEARVVEIVVQEGLAALGASAGSVGLVSAGGRAIEVRAMTGYDRVLAAPFREVALDERFPLADVARSGEPLFLRSVEERRARYPHLEALIRANGGGAMAAVPLSFGGELLGALGLNFAEPRSFDEVDRSFVVTLAQLCVQALVRARLAEAEQRARRRLALLAEAGKVLGSSLDFEETLGNLAGLVLPALGELVVVLAVDPEERPRALARLPEDPAAEAELGAIAARAAEEAFFGPESPSSALASGGEGDLERLVGSRPLALALRRLGVRSAMAVALRSETRFFGEIILCHVRREERHAGEDVELAEEIARRAASALENARLLAVATRERERAEAASRVKDEFLSTVSHELRTPLNAILGWASMLSSDGASAPTRQRGLEVIERAARAQAKLVEDLLDVSRVAAGKLRVELEPIRLDEVLEGAALALLPTAEAKGVELARRLDEAWVLGDAGRLRQVAWNLLSNAVRFTPSGGRVELRARREGGVVVVDVEDDGEGIPPEFLPFVFERFRQADGSTTRRHGGLGLGLAIARHIIEQHGGIISAESAGPGLGARFTFSLPCLGGGS